jgi:hypothetical protein
MSTLTASCHCGAVRVEIPRAPEALTNCNCSVCRRYGALWCYFPVEEVQVHAEDGATRHYAWGDRTLRFVRCATCGCVTHWEPIVRERAHKMGVNARLFEPADLGDVKIRRLDGAETWEYLD